MPGTRLAHKVIRHAPGEELQAVFDVLGELGHGNYGTVYRVMRKGQDGSGILAAKVVPKSAATDEDALRNEVALLDRLDHPHIVRIYDVFEDADQLSLVMELCSGGEVFAGEKLPLQEGTSAELTRQVLGALLYMHSHGVCHRDLKPSNLLYKTAERRHVKVADFGISKLFASARRGPNRRLILFRRSMEDKVGTAGFWAPEVCYGGSYSETCDIWSLGVLTFMALVGRMPFPEAGQEGVPAEPMELHMPDGLSQEARAFVPALLVHDAAERPSAKQVAEMPWLKSHAEASRVRRLKSLRLPSGQISLGLKGMLEYAKAGGLWRAAAAVAARHSDSDSVRQATLAFVAFDEDQDGSIPASVCREVLMTYSAQRRQEHGTGGALSKAEVEEVVEALEEDGAVDYVGFLAGVLASTHHGTDLLLDAFRMLDTDGDSRVCIDDLLVLASEDGAKEEWLAQRLQKLADSEGEVGLPEFSEVVRSLSSAYSVYSV